MPVPRQGGDHVLALRKGGGHISTRRYGRDHMSEPRQGGLFSAYRRLYVFPLECSHAMIMMMQSK